MKRLFIFYLALALLLSCSKNPERIGPCGSTNPLEDILWLKKEIEEVYSKPPDFGYACFTMIFKKERVFWFYSPNRFPDTYYVTCDGIGHNFPPLSEQDAETAEFRRITLTSKEFCKYLIWSTPEFRNSKICTL